MEPSQLVRMRRLRMLRRARRLLLDFTHLLSELGKRALGLAIIDVLDFNYWDIKVGHKAVSF